MSSISSSNFNVTATFADAWTVSPLDGNDEDTFLDSAAARDPRCLPLVQHWRDGPAEPGYQPAWACFRWSPMELRCDAYFPGASPCNRARSLNERTWETGDAGEIFLQGENDEAYAELHITPENMRLQLRWPPGALAAVRSKHRQLEEFMVQDPGWVHSHTRVEASAWAMQVRIPPSLLGLRSFEPGQIIRTAVCRYQQTKGRPVTSSTARFTAPSFHRPQEWHRLALGPAVSRSA